jgi:hypothetical protein
MPGALDRCCDLALMSGAETGSLALSDLAKAGYKTPQENCVPKVNVFYVFLAKIALHTRKGYLLRLFLHLLQ